MSLPADYTTIPVHGKWELLDGTPAAGSVTFAPSVTRLVDGTFNTVIMGSTIKATLDGAGEISLNLAATDDPDITGVPFAYTVTVSITSQSPYSFTLSVPFDTVGTIELASSSTATVPPRVTGSFVQSINGVSGILTTSDIDGAGVVVLAASAASTAGTAINAAITALSSGGTVIVPQGTWTIDTPILINRNGISIQGASNLGTLLRFDGSVVTTAIKMVDTTQRFGGPFTDFRIESTSDGHGTAIDASYFVNTTFQRLRIGTAGGGPNKGIIFNAIGSYYNVVRDVRVQQVSGVGSVGISFDNTSNSNTVDNVRIVGDANSTGIYVNAHAIQLNRVDIEQNCLIGIDVGASGDDCMISSPYLEAVQGTAIRLANGVNCPTILGGFVVDSVTANLTDNGANGLQIINTRLQYNPTTQQNIVNGAIALKSGAISMDSGSQVLGEWRPANLGAVAWTYDPAMATAGTLPTGGQPYYVGLQVAKTVAVTKIFWWVSTAGGTAVANQNQVGLFNAAGTLLASAVVDSDIGSATFKTTTIASQNLTPGMYWVGFVFNVSAGAVPTLARCSGLSGASAALSLNASVTAARFITKGSGATSLATFTPSGSSLGNSGTGFWAAIG